ncbi:MAG: hypothetical protein LAT75_12765 [Candidatus Cyclonatronum sp.]|uniref:hypothetical protein n=1 Tax=Cyclonatronum sp. TaxID=3024185 RepID=UPI0025BC7443|nr:hypothetical protein [Cyclonatronum sp.]MCH8487733.1 hypothetical protein [Cyclonatronum sp.]
MPEFANAAPSHAAPDDTDEVVLIFSYPAVGRVYVTALFDYNQNELLVPVTELFTLLGINYARGETQRNVIEGVFLTNGERYSMNFDNFSIMKGGRRYEFDAERMLAGALDFYLTPEVWREVFGLDFTFNFSALSLSLRTERVLPIEERRQREQARQRIEGLDFQRQFNPLLFPRERAVIRTGFLDYNLSGSSLINEQRQNYAYSFVGGLEFLGGDLQGSHVGGYTADGQWFNRTSNFRWRYVMPDNPFISTLTAGQLSTGGINSARIRGLSLTNEPIESRQLFGTYVLEGRAEPDSEVELYFNNRLLEYTRADGLGFYRFEIPLRYGTTRLETRIYTPSGAMQVSERQVQIPFVFLPQGQVQYNMEGGVLDQTFGARGTNLAAHGNVAYGLNSWLTTRAGLEYNEFESEVPNLYGSLSARVFSQYLVNMDVVPGAFYRAQSSVVFASSRSIAATYTYFDGESRFNSRRAIDQLNGNLYTPLPLGSLNAGIRVSGDVVRYSWGSETRGSGDLFFRLLDVNLRFNYRNTLIQSGSSLSRGNGQFTATGSYTIPRQSMLPRPFRSVFLRGSLVYDERTRSIRSVDAQLSRNIGRIGRFNVGMTRQLQNNITIVQGGLNLDLGGRVRSSTDFRGASGNYSARQALRGSVGFDDHAGYLQTTDRQQVGRAAASVLLFIDNNNSGTYDEGDEILPYAAVRLDRSASSRVGGDGVLRLTQLQSYFRYNLEINRNAIPHPLLVPAMDKFSFVADPNQYKRIEIPFYRSGVIDGSVQIRRAGETEGQGGMRLLLNGLDNNYSEVIRTFFGGGFYAMDIPPGRYTLEVDPGQLDFLGLVPFDGVTEFEIRSLADGDFVEDINIILVPPSEAFVPVTAESILEQQLFEELSTELQQALRNYVLAQQLIYTQDFRAALRAIDASLRIFETDHAIALKGTILHLLGDREEARRHWLRANERNPDILIPNTELLDLMMGTGGQR